MPKDGDKRYLYSVRGWLSKKREFPEEVLAVATYVENRERPHESDWKFRPETEDIKAIQLAQKEYGDRPLS